MSQPERTTLKCGVRGCPHDVEPNLDYCRGHEGGFDVGDRGRTATKAMDPLFERARAVLKRTTKLTSALRSALEHFDELEQRPPNITGYPEVDAEEHRHFETMLAIRRRVVTEQLAAVEQELRVS